MSVTALAQGIFQRQRDRLRSERVVSHDEGDEEDEEEGSFLNEPQPATNDNDDDEAEETTESSNEEGVQSFVARPTMTLAELEEEREVARRRSSACFLFAVFILFRLWMEALSEGNVTLVLVCLIGTSWTFRWIRYNRDQEAELDRRIANYLEHNENNDEIARDDIRMLSFQAQLALAIMESQRQMMMGGYGHPDGEQQSEGVSDEAKASWQCFCYKELRDKHDSGLNNSYGSLKESSERSEEEPHCSICLGEYEEGEDLVRLPCSHVYHAECINSWCSSHTRCPLCNCDLMATTATKTSADEQC